ncbi:MAG: hypothetical protein MK213_01135 [Planctomycetes bacterium]|nr:hypothetical protein [Planctomycetota bacterium]
MKHPLVIILLVALWTAPLSSQSYETLASESFDYQVGSLGGLSGGIGWESPWWSGTNLNDGSVTSPGFDPVGNKATTSMEHGGSYRLMDRSQHGPILDQGQFGADGTTIWVRFRIQRDVGANDSYGGLSLNWQWVGEQMFLGSPDGVDELGYARSGGMGHEIVPGTSVDIETFLVYRIDFLPGQERIQMWVNPLNDYPALPPDLDTLVDDFRFNEVRIQSGNGTMTGVSFDDIEITTPAYRPVYSVTNVVAGATATLSIVNCTAGNPVLIGYSVSGGGPTTTPYGDVMMSLPILQLPAQSANANGEVQLSVPVPGHLSGVTVWTQCAELTGGGAGILSNPIAVTVQ